MPNPQFTKPWHGVPREEILWNPTVVEEACIGCGTCVTGCSRLVYRYDYDHKKAVVADPLNCMVGCTTCANTCPTNAIRFPSLSTVFALEGLAGVRHVIEDDLIERHDQLAWHDVIPHPDKVVSLQVLKYEKRGEDILLLTLSPLGASDCLCQFIPGQYLEIIPSEGGWLPRAYSIANAPKEDGSIELQIHRVKEGRISEWLFERVHIGDVLRCRGPKGQFTLRSAAGTPLLFVAGGTGFAPIKAMIEQQLTHAPQSLISLFWGVSGSEDLYELSLLGEWVKHNPNMHITLAVSHGELPQDLPKGIEAQNINIVKAIYKIQNDFSGFDAYIAGAPSMIPLVIDALSHYGVKTEAIHVDSFGI
jgi:CDP-4-dehydro-6-deoxyglucose reductase